MWSWVDTWVANHTMCQRSLDTSSDVLEGRHWWWVRNLLPEWHCELLMSDIMLKRKMIVLCTYAFVTKITAAVRCPRYANNRRIRESPAHPTICFLAWSKILMAPAGVCKWWRFKRSTRHSTVPGSFYTGESQFACAMIYVKIFFWQHASKETETLLFV